MESRLKKLLLAGLAGAALAAPVVARADDDKDHDLAHELYEQGEIHALSDILRIMGKDTRGEVVAVDLILRGNKWIYRFQIVATNGHRTTVDVDAGAGAVIRGEGDD